MDSYKNKFLFVNKTARSKHLGRSSGSERGLIFSHAQRDPKRPRDVETEMHYRAFALCQCRCQTRHAYVYVNPNKNATICRICRLPTRESGGKIPYDSGCRYDGSQSPIPVALQTLGLKLGRDANEAFHFFTEKTAIEWSGWRETEFWQIHAGQMSASYPSVQHALVSLGAFHLSLEQANSAQIDAWRSLSLYHARSMLRTLVKDHSIVPPHVLALSLVVLTEVSALLHDATWLQAAQVEFNLMSNLRNLRAFITNWSFIADHVEPIIQKRRSRFTQKIDLVWSLRIAEPAQFKPRFDLNSRHFISLNDACLRLELLLNWVTYEVKTRKIAVGAIPVEAESKIADWFRALEAWDNTEDRQEIEQCQSLLLRISAKFGVLMIRTMYATDELVFDHFECEYSFFLEAYTKIMHFNTRTRRASANFATSSNLLCLMSNMVIRWCRNPGMRQKLISLLFKDDRREGHDMGYGWSKLAQHIQSIEEQGLAKPPTTAQDIPASNRIRVDRLVFYNDSYWMQVSYLRYPWREDDRETIWRSWVDNDNKIQLLPDDKLHCIGRNPTPSVIIGRGYAECFNANTGEKVLDIRDTRFFFPILRL